MLSELLNGAVADAKEREKTVSLATLEQRIEQLDKPINVYQALERSDQIKVIAEIKRASPSRGDLAELSDPAGYAQKYELGGASAISVLTESRKFKGNLTDLEQVKSSVSLPVLRKDFIGSSYQIYEARAYGADFILLILAALEDKEIAELTELATALNLGILYETHNLAEINRVKQFSPKLVGINARDLKTFELHPELFGDLAAELPTDSIKVAESAVHTADDVKNYRAAGADAILVGEALVTNDPVDSLKAFIAAGSF